jgi:type II secretory pathway component GspD/PulD (secretin)
VLGLQLGLTAQIGGDGIVSFHIVPTLTRIQRQVDVDVPLGFAKQTISNPVIDLQEVATTVRVRDGHPFVLAGLISKVQSTQKDGLPILGDLPLIGAFFRHSVQSESSSELVIYITPYIVSEERARGIGTAGTGPDPQASR